MKVLWSHEFDEALLRKVRSTFGRGGKATRREVRMFIASTIMDRLGSIEAPRVRVKPVKPEPKPEPPADTLCGACGKPFVAHMGMSRSCPLSKATKPGSRWTEAA